MLSQGLTNQLIERGLLSRDQAERAMMDARAHGLPFATWLIRQQTVDSGQLAAIIGTACGAALIDLRSVQLALCPRDAIDKSVARQFQVLPLVADTHYLLMVFADPSALRVVEVLSAPAREIEFVVADHTLLSAALAQWLSGPTPKEMATRKELEVLPVDRDQALVTEKKGHARFSFEGPGDAPDEAPVVRFVDQIILTAVQNNVSDIHFETGEEIYRIRFRIDGTLQDASELSADMAPRINARLKVMAGLDISERRRPQDGRIRIRLHGSRTIDLRLNSMPTLWGEKLVIRLLDGSTLNRPVSELGFDPQQTAMYLEALHRPQGLILVTGPTGSGKSVSLYSALQVLNTGTRNISTVEDPVEIYLEGINQVAVNSRTGMSFASALRAFLRQDPDVIMVGEIRDQETATVVITAAQTGHLVLSTLHTTSATESITRLTDMGVPGYALASALTLVIAQRLVPRLCQHCKQPQQVDVQRCRELGMPDAMTSEARLFTPGSCSRCREGYRGRIAIIEALPVSDELKELIRHERPVSEIENAACAAGMQPLRQSALWWAVQGEITLDCAKGLA